MSASLGNKKALQRSFIAGEPVRGNYVDEGSNGGEWEEKADLLLDS